MSTPSEPAERAALDRESLDLCQRLHTQPGNARLAAEIDAWRGHSQAHELSWRRAQSSWQASGVVRRQRESLTARCWLAIELGMERGLAALSAHPVRYVLPALLVASGLFMQLPGLPDTELPATGSGDAASPRVQTNTTTDDYISVWGEQRRVDLPDGSTITLNWDTALNVTFAAHERRVELQRGEALFAVAPDSARPFTVKVGSGSVTAVGTAFSIRHTGANELSTIVTEGVVRIEHPAASPLRLEAGYRAVANEFGISRPFAIDTETATAWTDGMLVFQDLPLADAITELGRYTNAPVRVRRVTGSARTVTATYFTARADDALALIAQAFELELTRDSDGSIVVSSAPPRRP